MWKKWIGIVTVAVTSGAFAEEARAEIASACARTITRSSVVPCAVAASLEVRAEQQLMRSLEGRKTASGVLLPSNPLLALSGARRAASPDAATNWYVTLSQELEIAGQRASRVRSAEASLTAQEARVVVEKREAAALAWSAYFEAVSAREYVRVTERLLAVTERMGVVARARSDKGLSASLDADLADAATLRLLQLKLAADRAVVAAGAQLTSIMGGDPRVGILGVEGDLVPLNGIPDAPPADASLAHRPELRAAEAEQRSASERASALRRSRVPNPTVSIYAQNDGFNEKVYGVGISLPVPLPAPVGRTYAGEIAEAEALAEKARVDRERVERDVRVGIVEAYATYAAHRRAVDAMAPERIRRAEDSLRDLQAEIEAGRLSVREALVAQQTLVELLQMNVAERRALCLASVELARALGLPLEGGAR